MVFGTAFDRDEKIRPEHVYEGDTVVLRINSHDAQKHGVALLGEVVDAPDEKWREHIADGDRLMVDYAVQSDSGVVWRWNMDNGYVIGPIDEEGRPPRSDIGRFGGFYEPEGVDMERLREVGQLVD